MIRERLSVQELWIAKKMNLWRPVSKRFSTELESSNIRQGSRTPDAQFVRYRINALRRRKGYQAVKSVDAKMRGSCPLQELVNFLGQGKWKYVVPPDVFPSDIELINFVQAEYEASNTAEDELAKRLFFEEV